MKSSSHFLELACRSKISPPFFLQSPFYEDGLLRHQTAEQGELRTFGFLREVDHLDSMVTYLQDTL